MQPTSFSRSSFGAGGCGQRKCYRARAESLRCPGARIAEIPMLNDVSVGKLKPRFNHVMDWIARTREGVFIHEADVPLLIISLNDVERRLDVSVRADHVPH